MRQMRAVYGVAVTLAVGLLICVALWEPPNAPPAGRYAVPSLTAWGKIFSFLLLAALGVAYLVWRRPVVQARAILETSPLGVGQPAVTLVDWSLLFKTLLAVEALAVGSVVMLRLTGRAPTTIDTLGIAAAGGIVAFVIHLLLLTRRGGDGEGDS